MLQQRFGAAESGLQGTGDAALDQADFPTVMESTRRRGKSLPRERKLPASRDGFDYNRNQNQIEIKLSFSLKRRFIIKIKIKYSWLSTIKIKSKSNSLSELQSKSNQNRMCRITCNKNQIEIKFMGLPYSKLNPHSGLWSNSIKNGKMGNKSRQRHLCICWHVCLEWD